MLITHDMLNKALEDKTPLFHGGDFIDIDVLYDLCIAPYKYRKGPGHKVLLASTDDREILCSELKDYDRERKISDKIFCNVKCKSCGENVTISLEKGKIIRNQFKLNDHEFKFNYYKFGAYRNPVNPHDSILCAHGYVTMWDIFTRKFGDGDDLYVCDSCKKKFVSDIKQEALEFLKRDDKFDWYRSDESAGDWRRGLFVEPYNNVHPFSGVINQRYEGTLIVAINGEVWTDDVYKEWEKRKWEEEKEQRIRIQQKEEEEQHYKRQLEEARKQKKIDDEAERKRTKRDNKLLFARLQSNTPTQRYISKFCYKDSDVDIYDRKIQYEALCPDPEEVNCEAVRKHNCKFYREYLQSPLWKIISSKVKWNANYQCEECGSKYNLQVHHTSYELKGVEFLGFETLKCLCSKCHNKEHEE